jgi:RNA polymerase sigma factor (sigma-70 family)
MDASRGQGGRRESIEVRGGEVMPNDDEFNDLLRRARAGDNGAIRDFLSQFEQEVRTMVRSRLPKKLRTQFDSTDFVQSVWQSFFVDSDSRDFDNIEHLRGFLFGVVRNKVSEQHRRLTKTEKYDLGREERLYVRRGDREVPRDVVSPEPSPSQTVQATDRMAQLTAGCSPLEIQVLVLRRQGLTFVEIAAQTGINERSVRRVIEAIRCRMESHRWQ